MCLVNLVLFTHVRLILLSRGWRFTYHGINRRPEDAGDTFLRNVGNHLQYHTVSQTRRPQHLHRRENIKSHTQSEVNNSLKVCDNG
jgi:hypothetical protein